MLRLEKGEEIVQTLRIFAEKTRLKGGFVFGLGVGKDLTIGYFDGHKKDYIKKEFRGEYEFTSFSGNISYYNKEPGIHIHITITDSKFNAYGGHLFQGYVPATLEILVLSLSKELTRFSDKDTGLRLLDL